MSTIKPIETVYNGYRFRSRLEARWAVFFDAMGIKYEYEPEGFEFEDGTKYLPDFLIFARHRSWTDEYEPVYAEVKGQMSPDDKHKIEQLAAHAPVIVLGSLNPQDWTAETYDEGFMSFRYMDGDEYPAVFSYYRGEPWICGEDHDEWTAEGWTRMDKALLKARQSRFEYGEKGGTDNA